MSFRRLGARLVIGGLLAVASLLAAASLRAHETPTESLAADVVSVIVTLDVAPLAAYRGGAQGLTATNPAATGASRLDARAPASRAYLSFLDARIAGVESELRAVVPNVRIVHRYRAVVAGVSAIVPATAVAGISALPGVKSVYLDRAEKLHTSHSPAVVDADDVWNGDAGLPSEGEGIVVGILDTGVWPEHPSFSDPDPLGRAYSVPPSTWVGTNCQFSGGPNPGDPYTCNNKLIAAYRFLDTFDSFTPPAPGEFSTARDGDGHGTHTASTAAGNAGVDASIFGVERGDVSGIAPRAHVAVYKVCGSGESSCYQSDSVRGVEQAVLDGVDVINFSISGGRQPYADIVSLAFLDAYDAGVFVAASAGNDGPAADTAVHHEPWVTTVAATQNSRAFASEVTMSAGSEQTKVSGASVMDGVGTATSLVDAADFADPLCQQSSADGLFAGKIVACQRGENSRVSKGFNVLQRGAAGMILFNPIANQGTVSDSHFLPAIHLENDAATTLLDFLDSHTDVTARFAEGEETPSRVDVVAAFSSRGGSAGTLGVAKPDIAAPGVDVLAGHTPRPHGVGASPDGELFRVLVGTSMASPHVAGAAALIRELHPEWTPGRIRSALMMNASIGVSAEDGITQAGPFATGTGVLDVLKAARSPLTMDANAQDYLDNSADLWNVDSPSIFVPAIGGSLAVERTVRSEVDTETVWKLRVRKPAGLGIGVPRSITVPARGETTFEIRIRAGRVALGETLHAVLRLVGPVRLRIPITIVRGENDITIAKSCSPTNVAVDETTNCQIVIDNLRLDDVDVRVVDALSSRLELVPGSVVGADEETDRIHFEGRLAGGTAAQVGVSSRATPFGYQPLGDFDYAPIPGVSDDDVVLVGTPPFTFGGRTYSQVGMAANGFVIIGGGTPDDGPPQNQEFPDPASPNNVVAPMWTDLDPHLGGFMRTGILTDNVSNWQVFDWEEVPDAAGNPQSFQIWIGLNGTDDVTWVYGPISPALDVTAGAENEDGSSGANVFHNGSGVILFEGLERAVTTTALQPGGSHTITFDARGAKSGSFSDCARLSSDALQGASVACAQGEVTP